MRLIHPHKNGFYIFIAHSVNGMANIVIIYKYMNLYDKHIIIFD